MEFGPFDFARNLVYLQAAIRDCIDRGESPYASHRMLTEALDDGDPVQRKLGIEAGFVWAEVADYVVVYDDLGLSPGMMLGIKAHADAGRTVVYRKLPGFCANWRRGVPR